MRCAAMNRMIRLPIGFWVLLLVLLFAARLAWAEPYKAEAGPYQVDSFLLELHDEQRDRDVPIKVYLPKRADGPLPIVLVSHGFGGSREGLSYLGEHWASHGYVCVHMQHLGSDEVVWRNLPAKNRLKHLKEVINKPQFAIDRAKDVPFVLDELERMHADKLARLWGRLDRERVGIGGHSYGAWTSMAAGGMTVGSASGRPGKTFADKRIKCMIPLSPPVVASKRLYEATYRTLNIPALFMTGTLDTSIFKNTTPEQRQVPYHTMPGLSDDGSPKYMINFDGADHMTFSGETKRRLRNKVSQEDNAAFHSIILQSTTAFLDSYLLDNKDAKAWLNGEGFVGLVGERGEVMRDVQ